MLRVIPAHKQNPVGQKYRGCFQPEAAETEGEDTDVLSPTREAKQSG